jgi:vacuolar-type H+-ATPase subunit I/STV1
MLRLGKRRQQNPEEIEEELVIDEGATDEFGLGQASQQINQQSIITRGVMDLRSYIEELSRRIDEITSIKGEIDKILQLKPMIENYINTLSEIVKTLNEIENLLNRLEELRRRL